MPPEVLVFISLLLLLATFAVLHAFCSICYLVALFQNEFKVILLTLPWKGFLFKIRSAICALPTSVRPSVWNLWGDGACVPHTAPSAFSGQPFLTFPNPEAPSWGLMKALHTLNNMGAHVDTKFCSKWNYKCCFGVCPDEIWKHRRY